MVMSFDTVLYVAVAIALYLVAVQIVRLLERRIGRPLGNRSLVFLVVFLILVVVGLKLADLPGFSGVF